MRAMTLPSPAEWAIIRQYAVRVRELWIMEAPEPLFLCAFCEAPSSDLSWTGPTPNSFPSFQI
ncbi:hypothetical protein L210DRAFT_3563939 [Boletus edulis BED1]|uniref:Uncharacterized protein n=1 Tax=Boletus edulis BED1 TaxID=1328754 RepID=A0AAD4G8N5_BOLED|nr:hypothetical protein L210DRAFT_3563939 [Boletus edulis BED1]